MTGEEVPNPQALIDSYGPNAPVLIGSEPGTVMSLGQALQMEGMCPVKSEDRTDPIKRARYLASILAQTGALRPEHQHLIEQP